MLVSSQGPQKVLEEVHGAEGCLDAILRETEGKQIVAGVVVAHHLFGSIAGNGSHQALGPGFLSLLVAEEL